MSKKDVAYVYTILLTPMGKGYGCFAIKRTNEENKFLIGAAYCHPSDRNKFRKRIARKISSARTNTEFVLDPDTKLDYLYIVRKSIESGDLFMPSWAKKAYNAGTFTFGLSSNMYGNKQLLNKIVEQDKTTEKLFVDWVFEKTVACNFDVESSFLQLLKQHHVNDKDHPV